LAYAPANCNFPSSFEGRTGWRHKIKYMIVAVGVDVNFIVVIKMRMFFYFGFFGGKEGRTNMKKD
jgi:hypothetical protein